MSINGEKVSIKYKVNRATKFVYCKNNNNGTPRHHKEEKNLRWAILISGYFFFILSGVWAHVYNDSLYFSEVICPSALPSIMNHEICIQLFNWLFALPIKERKKTWKKWSLYIFSMNNETVYYWRDLEDIIMSRVGINNLMVYCVVNRNVEIYLFFFFAF